MLCIRRKEGRLKRSREHPGVRGSGSDRLLKMLLSAWKSLGGVIVLRLFEGRAKPV
jgi:hypothetical protein